MQEEHLIELLSAARQLYNDGHRQLAMRVNAAFEELQLGADVTFLIEGLFTAMLAECKDKDLSSTAQAAARFYKEWPHLAKAVDALMRRALKNEFPWVAPPHD